MAFAKSFERPSAYSVKRQAKEGGFDLYGDVIDRIDGILHRVAFAEVVEWLDANDHTFPSGWRETFNDRLELKREELEREDIGSIVRDRFDF